MHVVVRQVSGLGNQLFQYAAGLYFSRRYDARMSMVLDAPQNATSHGYPRPFLLSKFSITAPYRHYTAYDRLLLSTKAAFKPLAVVPKTLMGVKSYTQDFDRRYIFLPDLPVSRQTGMLYLGGYWQAYGYSEEIAGELRREFAFREPASGQNLEVLKRMEQSEHPVSLHMRRGDYTLAAEGNIALPLTYYEQAIRYFKERLGNPTFFVFSDDIEFAKTNLPRDIDAVFVDHNDSFTAHEDLRLMSACHDHIMANSTFSWWGAWLNPRPNKTVYAPKYWLLKRDSYFPDLMPPSWVLAEN